MVFSNRPASSSATDVCEFLPGGSPTRLAKQALAQCVAYLKVPSNMQAIARGLTLCSGSGLFLNVQICHDWNFWTELVDLSAFQHSIVDSDF